MIGVKITVLLFLFTFVWDRASRVYFYSDSNNMIRAIEHREFPWYVWVDSLLALSTLIGVIYSVVYLLFFM